VFSRLCSIILFVALVPALAEAQIGSSCLRPLGIPDKWAEAGTPPWDPMDTYDPSTGDTYLDGYNPEEDHGRPFTLQLWTGGPTTGQSALAVRTGVAGGTGWRSSVLGCSGLLHLAGDTLQVEAGNLTGPLAQAIDQLIAMDAGAIWDPSAHGGRGGVVNSAFEQSPRVIALPVFAPGDYAGGTVATNASIRIEKIVGFFITARLGTGAVAGYLTAWSVLTPASASARPNEYAQLSASVLGPGTPLVNLPLEFLVNEELIATAPTDGTGTARLPTTAYNVGDHTPGTYTGAIRVRISDGAGFFIADEASADLTVLKKLPQIHWATPADIVYGTTLTASQLNATADVPGMFSYDPAPGTVLSVASNHALSAMFTPDDGEFYESVTASAILAVTPAPLILTVNDTSQVYLDPFPAFSFSSNGFVNGEGASVLNGSPSFHTSATTASPVGAYAVSLNGLSAANYSITYQPGVLTITPRGSATTLSAPSPATALYGQAVAVVASVSSDIGNPSGRVVLLDFSTPIATSPIVNGQATFAVSSLTAGAHTISAVYAGDGNFSGSTSGTRTLSIAKANTTTQLTSSLNPSRSGQAVTFTASVSAVSPGGGPISGSVQFLRNGALLGSASVTNGQATLTTSSLTVGKHQIQARYVESSNHLGSTSPTMQQTVKGGGK
jgi:hypothetical protein